MDRLAIPMICEHEITSTHIHVHQIEVASSVPTEKPSEPHFVAIVISRVGKSYVYF